MEVVELFTKSFVGIESIYFWVILAMLILFFSKLNISYENTKEKILISYLFLLLLKYFQLISIKFIVIFLVIFSFIYLEIISMDIKDKQLLQRFDYYIIDYIYKMIFKYHFIGYLLSLLVISNYSNKLFTEILENINGYYILGLISMLIYLYVLSKVLSNKFNTLSLSEIEEQMKKILPFEGYRLDKRLEDFSKILTFYEDKSYFNRGESHNLFSISFLKYKYNRVKSNRKNKIYKIKIIGEILKHIVTILLVLYYTIKFLIINCINFIKAFFYKFISRKNKIKYIRSYVRGYSTIEMQLIRTLALKDGYNCTIQRKVYELIYSNIFFKSLHKKYLYYRYFNINYFKYYLIHLYILNAPTFINGIRHDSIEKLFKERKNILEITNEEFFIYCLGLAGRQITRNLINKYYSPVKLNNLMLSDALNEILGIVNKVEENKISIKIMLFDKRKAKRFPIVIQVDNDMRLKDIIKYIEKTYCEKDHNAIIDNINEIIYGRIVSKDSLSIIDNDFKNYRNLLKVKLKDINYYSKNSKYNIIIVYNLEYGLGFGVGNEDGIKYEFHNNEKSIHANLPHINCKYSGEEIRINLLDNSIMDKKEFKSPVVTKKAKKYVKKNREQLLDIWENVVDKDNYYNKKISKNIKVCLK